MGKKFPGVEHAVGKNACIFPQSNPAFAMSSGYGVSVRLFDDPGLLWLPWKDKVLRMKVVDVRAFVCNELVARGLVPSAEQGSFFATRARMCAIDSGTYGLKWRGMARPVQVSMQVSNGFLHTASGALVCCCVSVRA